MTNTPAAPRQLALIVSVGASDIKYWSVKSNEREADSAPLVREERLPINNRIGNDAKTAVRATAGGDADVSCAAPPPRPSNLRAVHQQLLDHRTAWRFATCEEAKAVLASGAWRERRSAFAEQLGMRDCLHDAQGRVLMSPAKVAEIAQALSELREQFAVVDVAVIHTARTPTEGWPFADEPIASGPLILEYLRSTLGVADNHSDNLINAITDSGRLEGDQPDGADFPVRRAVAHALERGIAAFAELLDTRLGDIRSVVPVLLTTGGMAPIKDVLRSIVAVRFNQMPRDLSTPEGRIRDPQALVRARLNTNTPVISRHEAIDARARALYLVRRGDFPGAWAAVSQFQGSQADQWWLQPLHEVARYFGAAPGTHKSRMPTHHDPRIVAAQARVFDALDRASLVHTHAIDCHKKFVLSIAFRLEAALQGDDHAERRFADALSAVCTLIDTLVITRAMQLLDDKGPDGLQARNRLNIKKFCAITGVITLNSKKNKFRCIENKWRAPGNFVVNNKRADWYTLLSPCQPGAGTDPENTWFKSLRALSDAVDIAPSRPPRSVQRLRDLRNNSTHSALSSADLDRIRELGEAHRIWRYHTTQPGHHALAPAAPQHHWPGLVHAALCSAGIHDAAGHYRNLVNGLIDVLQSVEPVPESTHPKTTA